MYEDARETNFPLWSQIIRDGDACTFSAFLLALRATAEAPAEPLATLPAPLPFSQGSSVFQSDYQCI
jgi:hypothetical protein